MGLKVRSLPLIYELGRKKSRYRQIRLMGSTFVHPLINWLFRLCQIAYAPINSRSYPISVRCNQRESCYPKLAAAGTDKRPTGSLTFLIFKRRQKISRQKHSKHPVFLVVLGGSIPSNFPETVKLTMWACAHVLSLGITNRTYQIWDI